MPEGTESADDEAPPRIHRIARAAAAAALPAAFAVFILHLTGAALTGARGFAESVCWCTAAGAAGSPAYISGLRRRIGSRGVAAAGWLFLGAAALFSVMDLSDNSLHPAPGTRLATLMLLLSVSVSMVRAAQYFAARERDRIMHRLKETGLEQQLEDQRAAHEKEMAQLRGECADAVTRARAAHMEGCVLAGAQRTAHLAELVDALADVPEESKADLAAALGAPGGAVSRHGARVVPFPAKVNGGH